MQVQTALATDVKANSGKDRVEVGVVRCDHCGCVLEPRWEVVVDEVGVAQNIFHGIGLGDEVDATVLDVCGSVDDLEIQALAL